MGKSARLTTPFVFLYFRRAINTNGITTAATIAAHLYCKFHSPLLRPYGKPPSDCGTSGLCGVQSAAAFP